MLNSSFFAELGKASWYTKMMALRDELSLKQIYSLRRPKL